MQCQAHERSRPRAWPKRPSISRGFSPLARPVAARKRAVIEPAISPLSPLTAASPAVVAGIDRSLLCIIPVSSLLSFAAILAGERLSSVTGNVTKQHRCVFSSSAYTGCTHHHSGRLVSQTERAANLLLSGFSRCSYRSGDSFASATLRLGMTNWGMWGRNPYQWVKLFLLGPPRIERDGVPVKVDTRKAIALVAYLAVTRQSHTRDALAALLWPDYDQTRARAALRRTLSTLRKALTGVEMDVDRENISVFSPMWAWGLTSISSAATCRAARLQTRRRWMPATSASESLAEAVGLYRDDFMAGFTLRDSVNFDEWQFFETEALRRELAGALERLVRCHSALGEFAPAVDYARRWLALDPLDEPAHRYLMQSYAWAGQRSSALHQYEECVRILEEELGVPPLAETTQLYEAIRSGSLPDRPTLAPPGEPTAPPTGREYDRSGDYPLVGRSEEMGHLLEAYSAISVDGQFIVLEGEAGVGKTRLAEGFAGLRPLGGGADRGST